MTRYFGTHFGTYEVARAPDGRAQLKPFAGDPAPSLLGAGFLELADHPLRVRGAMVRAGWWHGASDGRGRGREEFLEQPLDAVLDRLAGTMSGIIAESGNSSIFAGSYGWASAGRFHHAPSQIKRALNLLGGFTGTVNTYSYGTAGVLLPHVLGASQKDACDTAPYWDDIADRCDLLLAFGGFRAGNVQVESGGAGRHDVGRWLDAAAGKGCRIVVISPSRSDIPPGLRAEHVAIRPNTDAALLLAMAHVLHSEGLADRAFLARCTIGFNEFAGYLESDRAPTPETAETITGVPAAVIRDLARSLASQRSTVTLSWSLQRARHGEQPYWAAVALAAMAGQIGQPGRGVAFGLGSVSSVGNPVRRLAGPALPQGRNRVETVIPVARITELLERPGQTLDYDGRRITLPETRMIWWAGGNPFHHHQDLNRLAEAWRRPELVVVQEPFWTTTARMADVVLPSALPHERNDIAGSARDNWLIASPAIDPPPNGMLTDHETLARLMERFGQRAAFTEGRDEMGWIAALYEGYRQAHPDLPEFDAFWAQGFARLEGRPTDEDRRQRLARFVADPEGAPLDTPSGRIELFSKTIAGFGYPDCPGHPVWLEPEEWLGAPTAARFPLHLISPQPEGRLHSQLDAAAASVATKRGGREQISLNPGDAALRGIRAGDVVRAFNDRGALLAVARIDEGLMAGVAALPTGSWLDPDPATGIDRHGNPNVLTEDIGTSRLSQGPSANSCLIEVERWDGPALKVAIHVPPTIIPHSGAAS